ncbi:MAG TPA: M50 family metallopeptidase [Polyangiales bacterium]|jgi:regulator of sigma E protease|nr:M50 family metallopeptidase [Polyangiales bacterium]
MLQVLVAIFGISLLVIVHEAGHYLMARAFGIRVTRFSIGLGPVLAKYQPKGSPTVFQLCAIPFLAYVMIAGMNPAEEIDPNDPELYPNKSILARVLTIFGGPLANYLAASVMIFALALSGWRDEVPTEPMVVSSVEAGTPADKAGLKAGDVILEANGKPIRNVRELIDVTLPRAGQATTYVLQRDGKALPPVTIVPRNNGGKGVIGVTPKFETRTRALPIGEATTLAVTLPWTLTVRNIEGMVDLIKRRSTEGITGPVGMGKLVAQQAEKGIYPFVGILIAISVALGYFNLLPFPALDGGRLVFLGYEVITRRRPNERIEAAVHAVGLLFLLGVIALVTLRDVVG